MWKIKSIITVKSEGEPDFDICNILMPISYFESLFSVAKVGRKKGTFALNAFHYRVMDTLDYTYIQAS